MLNPLQSTLSLTIILLLITSSAAFQIHGSAMALTRLDPIVNPGTLSSHAHMILGGSNFGPTLTSAHLEDSTCSSLETQQDMSAYWVSPPYGQNANGSWNALPVTSVSIYYKKVKNEPIVPFPPNFRMLIGDPSATAKNFKDPFMSYQCQNFIPTGDPTGQWNFSSGWERLPTMDCSRIKLATTFPNCWDGVNADSPNHRDHVHNDIGDGTKCPDSHPKRIAQITLEIDFWSNDYKWQDIALSSGSKSGWGIHADYFFGWKNGGEVLNKALADPTCIEAQGIEAFYNADSRCDTLIPYANETAGNLCAASLVSSIAREEVGITRAIPELPGCNPRFDGPGYPATKPTCDRVIAPVAIGAPKRLFAWDDKDPRHVSWPRKLAVWDSVSTFISSSSSTSTTKASSLTTLTSAKIVTTAKSTITTTKSLTTTKTTSFVSVPTGPASGTMYLTQGQSWDGYAENWTWTRGACKVLTSAFSKYLGSAGPNAGTCVFYDDQSCKGNVLLTIGYPGKSNLGATGKKVVTFSCT